MQIIQDLTARNVTRGGMREVRGIVLHSMDGFYKGTISWFRNPQNTVSSAHVLISKEGEVRQMVKDTDMAWHAGIYDAGKCPDWALPNPNQYCLGVELEDEKDPNWNYPEPQRQALRDYLALKMNAYDIPRERLLLHRNLNPSRRSDPVGQFSWNWVFPASPQPAPPSTIEKLPKDSIINDIYKALVGENASPEELNWRLKSNKNLVEIITDICSGDGRFFKQWVKPHIPELEPPDECEKEPSTPVPPEIVEVVKEPVFTKPLARLFYEIAKSLE